MSNRPHRHPGRQALDDQIAAAARDTDRAHRVAATLLESRPQLVRDGAVMHWLEDWRTVGLKCGCVHSLNPRPLHGLICVPGAVYCVQCLAPALAATVDDDYCDACGRTSSRIHELVIRYSAVLTLHGNICPACCRAALGIEEVSC